MAGFSSNRSGLMSHISHLLNNSYLSDVSVSATINNNSEESYFCHKLILALRSKPFQDMLYKSGVSVTNIKLSTDPVSLYSFLKFLYTDELEIRNLQEAFYLLSLSREYQIDELQALCQKYISSNRLTLENVIDHYELALKESVKELLDNCQKFVAENAPAVLESRNFLTASGSVIQNIIKLDYLNISSEVQVIKAVMSWCESECNRKTVDINDTNLKLYLKPFLCNLRFLSLSFEELGFILEKYNILTAYESSIITGKIIDPNAKINIPANICPIDKKRHSNNIIDYNITSDFDSEIIDENAVKRFAEKQGEYGLGAYSMRSELNNLNSNDKVPYKKKYLEDSTLKSKDESQKISNTTSNVKFQYSQPSLFDKSSQSLSNPLKSSPVSNFSSYENCNLLSNLECNFKLEDIVSNLKSNFPKDVTCKIRVDLEKGNISISGVEVQIKESDNYNDLTFNVYSSGFVDDIDCSLYCNLRSNKLLLQFPKPLVTKNMSSGEIAVSLDGVILKRLNVLRFGVEIYQPSFRVIESLRGYFKLTSTQKNENGYIFFISRLIYDII